MENIVTDEGDPWRENSTGWMGLISRGESGTETLKGDRGAAPAHPWPTAALLSGVDKDGAELSGPELSRRFSLLPGIPHLLLSLHKVLSHPST